MRPVLTQESQNSTLPSDSTTRRFELRGQFAGFFRDVFGERRMVLRVAKVEMFLTISKVLSQELSGVLVAGQEVVVEGQDLPPDSRGRGGRVVSHVHRAEQVSRQAGPIRVCANKTCWRTGGQALYKELEQRIAEAGLTETVKLRAVACMDRCKQGPNVECGGLDFSRCTLQTVDEILAQFDHLPRKQSQTLCSQDAQCMVGSR